jgi:DNA-directed RNA polymerase specialized sigma24 family protein
MDPLLLPLAQAPGSAEQERLTAELVLTMVVPLIRQTLRQRLGFHINVQGRTPYHQEAADIYQDILLKILQTLRDRLNSGTLSEITSFRHYVLRVVTKACHDYHRAQSPVYTRFKTFLHYLLTHHTSFALWHDGPARLCGLAGWHGGSSSVWAQRRLDELAQHPAAATQLALSPHQLKQENLSQVVGAVLAHAGGPVELDALAKTLFALLALREQPSASLDDPAADWAERLTVSLPLDSRYEQRALLRRLWHEVCQLPPLQRDAFCFGFADKNGEDLFALLLYDGEMDFTDLAQGLARTPEELYRLWAEMPLGSQALATLLGATRAQVNKWRFRAVAKLGRSFLTPPPANKN